MQVAIGCDHAGLELKQEISRQLEKEGYTVFDCGSFNEKSVDYPDIAEEVAAVVLEKELNGIIICGTGIGISIAANKVPGIRAALCNDIYSARLARKHNDANIVAVGARVTGEGLAIEIVNSFLSTEFEGGRHQCRIDKITAIENKWRTGTADKNGNTCNN